MGTQVEIIRKTKDYFWACLNMGLATNCMLKRELKALTMGFGGSSFSDTPKQQMDEAIPLHRSPVSYGL
jgi:hypothetical protein